jgi:sugar phosphate isomerase/epimerase
MILPLDRSTLRNLVSPNQRWIRFHFPNLYPPWDNMSDRFLREALMRFGIMTMQIEALVPSGLSADRMLAHVAGFDIVNLVRELSGHDFNPIELGGDMSLFLPHTLDQEAIARLAALKTELDLSFTVHLPLWSVEPSTPLEPVRLGSAQALIDTVLSTRPLQPEVYVLHATGALAAEFYRMRLPEMARALLLRQFQARARDSIQSLLAVTELPSRRLAIETIEFPLDLTLELAEELDLSICFDTGHVLAGFSGLLDFFDALDRCLPRLAEIHLHDSPALQPQQEVVYGKDHQPLGSGDLPLDSFLDRLETAGFDGPLVFELRLEEALASLETIRMQRPELVV